MNNYFQLTPFQFEKIISFVPFFNSEDIEFNARVNYTKEFIGGEWVKEGEIEWLDVKIDKGWHIIINGCDKFAEALFELTDEQYRSILEKLNND
jgi:hypothetical protein